MQLKQKLMVPIVKFEYVLLGSLIRATCTIQGHQPKDLTLLLVWMPHALEDILASLSQRFSLLPYNKGILLDTLPWGAWQPSPCSTRLPAPHRRTLQMGCGLALKGLLPPSRGAGNRWRAEPAHDFPGNCSAELAWRGVRSSGTSCWLRSYCLRSGLGERLVESWRIFFEGNLKSSFDVARSIGHPFGVNSESVSKFVNFPLQAVNLSVEMLYKRPATSTEYSTNSQSHTDQRSGLFSELIYPDEGGIVCCCWLKTKTLSDKNLIQLAHVYFNDQMQPR